MFIFFTCVFIDSLSRERTLVAYCRYSPCFNTFILHKHENEQNYTPQMGEVYKVCPYCNAKVKVNAKACPVCKRALN